MIFSVEASCNAAGMGYSGCDDEGNPQWEVSKNCRPMDYEVSEKHSFSGKFSGSYSAKII